MKPIIGMLGWVIFAALITLLHLSVNSTMCLPNSAGELANTVSPNSAIRSLILELQHVPTGVWTSLRHRRRKKIGPGGDEFCAINTGGQWLTVSRISATSSTDRAVVDPVSCRLGA